MSDLPVIILGAGGHAKVLIDSLLQCNRAITGITAPGVSLPATLLQIPFIGDDDEILRYSPRTICLVNGLGSIGIGYQRRALFLEWKNKGYNFANVIHPSAILARTVELSEGVQVMAGAVIQPGVRIGRNTIVNTRASLDHDCIIGDHVHLAPGVTLSGGVIIAEEVHIGTGATIIQGVKIGANSIIAAGSVIVSDIPPNSSVRGNPGRVINSAGLEKSPN